MTSIYYFRTSKFVLNKKTRMDYPIGFPVPPLVLDHRVEILGMASCRKRLCSGCVQFVMGGEETIKLTIKNIQELFMEHESENLFSFVV